MIEHKEEFQVTPGEVVLTAEIVLGILATVASFGVFPGWLVLLIPILSAELPLTQGIFTTLWNMLVGAKKVGAPPKEVLTILHNVLQEAHVKCQQQWATGNTQANSFPWTLKE